MANIIKMRIIRDRIYSFEVEYLLEFFKFIGFLTYDDVDNENQNPITIKNDNNEVTIFLNHLKNEFSYNYKLNNTFYLYFSFKKNICTISDIPLTLDEVLSQPIIEDKMELRKKALTLLTNKIWENDEENRKSIEYILNSYISIEEDKDLFYALQFKKCNQMILRSSFAINEAKRIARRKYKNNIENEKYKDELFSLCFNNYVKKIYVEFCEIRTLMSNNINNPYIFFTFISTYITLLELNELLYNSEKKLAYSIFFKNATINIYDSEKLIEMLENMFLDNKNKEFIPTILLYILKLIDFIDFNNSYYSYFKKMCLKKLIDISEESKMRGYYDDVYISGAEFLEEAKPTLDEEFYNKKIEFYLNQALKCNPNNFEANYKLALYNAKKDNFEFSLECLSNITYFYNSSIFPLTLKELIFSFEINILKIKIYLNQTMENGVKNSINFSLYLQDELEQCLMMKEISSPNENLYLEFIKYHMYSVYLFYLLNYIKNNILALGRDSKCREKELKKKLARWKGGLEENN